MNWKSSISLLVIIAFSLTLLGSRFASSTELQTRSLTSDSIANYSCPVWSPDGKRIAYSMSDGQGGWIIGVMNEDGTGKQNLTLSPGWDFAPAWSKTANEIAFLTNRSNPNGLEIWSMNSDGTTQQPVVDTPISQASNSTNPTYISYSWSIPTWNPDGTRIAFSGYLNSSHPYNLVICSTNGTKETQLTNSEGYDVAAAWSPNGNNIAFSSMRANNWDVWTVDVDGNNPEQLTNSSDCESQPAWSPDSSRIAFVSNHTGIENIWIMDANGNNKKQLTNSTYFAFYPAWSPDGKEIAFASNKNGKWDIWVTKAPAPQGGENYIISQDISLVTVAIAGGALGAIGIWLAKGKYVSFIAVFLIIVFALLFLFNIMPPAWAAVLIPTFAAIAAIASSWRPGSRDSTTPNSKLDSKLDPRYDHIEAWLFYEPETSYEKGEITPERNNPREKLVCNTRTKEAYYVDADIWNLIKSGRVRWHIEDKQNLERWCNKRGYHLNKRDAREADILAG